MYRVLMPVDENEARAKQAARDVASLPRDPDDIDVVALNVEQPYSVGDGGGRVSAEEFFDESDYPESMDAAVELLEERGISVERQRVYGDASEEILTAAAEIDADLITMSGRKRSPSGKVLFGSVTQSVLLDAEQPVMVSTQE
jgi:nucleotide-binding universal stress UspA family protein